MPRHHKANKRAASRRHPSATASRRPSSNAATTRPLPPTSITPTQTRMSSHMQAAPMPQPPATVPAPDSPPSHHPQHRQDAQDHRDRRAHPNQAALKERAFALSCIGHRSPAIAVQLGVSERTVRHWNRATLRVLALEASRVSPDLDATSVPEATTTTDAAADPDLNEYHRALAIERQLDIAVTTRAAYARLMAQHDQLLTQITAACDANIAATTATATATGAGRGQ